MFYSVIRDLANNRDVQLKKGSRHEAEYLLESIQKRWEAVADAGEWNGGPPYTTELTSDTLTVRHGGRVIDRYVIEVVK
jgi:hypothetical protein